MIVRPMIDVHAHAVLAGVMGCAGHYGPELGTGPEGRPRFRVGRLRARRRRLPRQPRSWTSIVRLAMNDRLGIDLQVLSPNPLTYFHHIEADVAAGFCRWHNDELAALVAAHPDRFRGFAQLPMQDVDAGVPRSCAGPCASSGCSAPTSAPTSGPTFDDERLDPLWATAVELDVPMFVHPAPAGIDGPLRDARIRSSTSTCRSASSTRRRWPWPASSTAACSTATRRSTSCLSHGGGAAAFMLGRLATSGPHRARGPGRRPVDFAGGPATAVVRPARPRRRGAGDCWKTKVGRDRLVVGTNLAGWDAADRPG